MSRSHSPTTALHRQTERARIRFDVHHLLDAKTITITAAPARSRIVLMLIPPIEVLSKELAAVLLEGVVIVTPFGPVYVVVGAMTLPAI